MELFEYWVSPQGVVMKNRVFLSAEEKKQYVAKLRDEGLTFNEIGQRLSVSGSRANQIYLKHQRDLRAENARRLERIAIDLQMIEWDLLTLKDRIWL